MYTEAELPRIGDIVEVVVPLGITKGYIYDVNRLETRGELLAVSVGFEVYYTRKRYRIDAAHIKYIPLMQLGRRVYKVDYTNPELTPVD